MVEFLYPTRIPSSEMRPLTKGRQKTRLLSSDQAAPGRAAKEVFTQLDKPVSGKLFHVEHLGGRTSLDG